MPRPLPNISIPTQPVRPHPFDDKIPGRPHPAVPCLRVSFTHLNPATVRTQGSGQGWWSAHRARRICMCMRVLPTKAYTQPPHAWSTQVSPRLPAPDGALSWQHRPDDGNNGVFVSREQFSWSAVVMDRRACLSGCLSVGPWEDYPASTMPILTAAYRAKQVKVSSALSRVRECF